MQTINFEPQVSIIQGSDLITVQNGETIEVFCDGSYSPEEKTWASAFLLKKVENSVPLRYGISKGYKIPGNPRSEGPVVIVSEIHALELGWKYIKETYPDFANVSWHFKTDNLAVANGINTHLWKSNPSMFEKKNFKASSLNPDKVILKQYNALVQDFVKHRVQLSHIVRNQNLDADRLAYRAQEAMKQLNGKRENPNVDDSQEEKLTKGIPPEHAQPVNMLNYIQTTKDPQEARESVGKDEMDGATGQLQVGALLIRTPKNTPGRTELSIFDKLRQFTQRHVVFRKLKEDSTELVPIILGGGTPAEEAWKDYAQFSLRNNGTMTCYLCRSKGSMAHSNHKNVGYDFYSHWTTIHRDVNGIYENQAVLEQIITRPFEILELAHVVLDMRNDGWFKTVRCLFYERLFDLVKVLNVVKIKVCKRCKIEGYSTAIENTNCLEQLAELLGTKDPAARMHRLSHDWMNFYLTLNQSHVDKLFSDNLWLRERNGETLYPTECWFRVLENKYARPNEFMVAVNCGGDTIIGLIATSTVERFIKKILENKSRFSQEPEEVKSYNT